MRRICIFSGSSCGARPEYAVAARTLGFELAARGLELVYGGGNIGLIGIVADAVLNRGGRVTGVIPERLADLEVAHREMSDLRIVDTVDERFFKAKYFDRLAVERESDRLLDRLAGRQP